MLNTVYGLDICEVYPDLEPLRVNDVLLMQCFVDLGFKGADLKSLNFTRKYIEVITLADIATVDGHRVSQQAFEAISSNGLRCDIKWPKAVPELSPAAVILLKKAIIKSFINLNSG